MALDIYATSAIRGVIRALVAPKPFLLETFFRNVINSQEEEIAFDVEIRRRRVSPFVSPLLPARLVASPGYRVDKFKPACVKDLRAIDPNRPLKRAVGERLAGGEFTGAQREAAILALELQDQMDMNTRRLEVMAADALDDGIVTVTGEGYDAVAVNYQRPSALTVTLAGSARWGEAGVSPVANLQTWSTAFLRESGLQATDIVVDEAALSLLQADARFEKAVDTTRRGTTASADFAPPVTEGGALVGYLNNTQRIWLYANWFVDPADNTEKPILPANTVLFGNDSADGSQTRGFAAIPDPHLEYKAEEFMSRSWLENNPGQRFLLGQSCPLPILSRPAATFRARVR